jgi:hypothetical protein
MLTAVILIIIQTFVDRRTVITVSFVVFLTRTVVRSFVVTASCVHMASVVVSVLAFIDIFTICSISRVSTNTFTRE